MNHSLHKEVEILIHISAPSGAKDDNRYRRQTSAYFNFRCQDVTSLSQGQDQFSTPLPRLAEATRIRGQVSEASPCRRDPPHNLTLEKVPSVQHDGSEAISASSDLISRHLSSPCPSSEKHAPTLYTRPGSGDPVRYSMPLVSLPSTQHLDGNAILRALDTEDLQRVTTKTPERPLKAQEDTTRSEPSTQYGSWRTPSSVISNSQPSVRLLQFERSSPLFVKRLSQQSPSHNLPSKRRRLQPPKPKEPTGECKGEQRTGLDGGITTSPLVAPDAVNETSKTLRHLDQPTATPSSLEIHPPPPTTTTLPFFDKELSHVTPTLNMLACKIDISKRFNPFLTSRPLRPLERGYWRIDTSPWPTTLRDEFWAFLQDLVGDGRVGWGVWCAKTGAGWREDGKGMTGDEGSGLDGDNIVRVYCWGEVVGHIYLVLFLASSRKIKGMGARWIDSGGELVVQMT